MTMPVLASASSIGIAKEAACLQCGIWNSGAFIGSTFEQFEHIIRAVEHRTFEPHVNLYESGATGSQAFSLRSGAIKLVKQLANGGERIVRIKTTDQLFGLESVLNQPYHHTATTLTPVEVCCIPIGILNELDQRYPGFHRQVITRYQQMLVDEGDAFITDLSTGKSPARLARLLLRYFMSDGLSDIWRYPAREDLANMLGITIETTSRLMAEFKRKGYISEEHGHLSVRDVTTLARIAEG